MSSRWKTAPLGELALNISKPFKLKGRSSVVFINTGDILAGEFLHRTTTSPQGLPGQAKKAISNGDILYSEIRPGNKRHLLVNEDNPDDFVVSTKFMVIRPKGDVSPEYLYLVLTNNDCEAEFKIIADSRSGTFPQITFDSISYYPIRYPNPELQKRIVEFDSAFTRKMRVNKKINQTLEQMAQAIFKSWFVDFEPVKAKIAALEAGGNEEDALLAAMQAISGKDTAQLAQLQAEKPEHYNQLRSTAELFPSAMQNSELGEIPEGWLLEPFSNIARLDTTSVKPAKEPEKTWEHYSIPAFDNGMSPAFDLGADIKSNKYRVFPSSVLVSKLNPHFPRTWLPDVLDSSAAICSTEFMQFVPIKPTQRAFVAGVVKSESFQNGIMMRVTGSTGSRQRAQPKQVAEMEVLLPSEELRNIYSGLIAPQLESQASNIREALNLADVRDTLLPRLLSGELQVNSTDRVHAKLPNDKDEHGLTSVISEIESNLPPKSRFVENEIPANNFSHVKLIGYATISGAYGEGGAEYFKLPTFLRALRNNKALEKLFTATVDGASGVPFLVDGVTAVLNKFLGKKIKFDQRTALVLLAFPKQLYRETSELLENAYQLSMNAGLPPIDESQLLESLNDLNKHGLVVSVGEKLEEWRLVEKFRHEIDNWS